MSKRQALNLMLLSNRTHYFGFKDNIGLKTYYQVAEEKKAGENRMPGRLLIAQTLEIPNYIHYIRGLQMSDNNTWN
jgi:hypothetical protein